MKESDTRDLCRQLHHCWQQMDQVYEDHARSCCLSYASLDVLAVISGRPCCTQKDIGQRTHLPKQTVNSIVSAFYREGLVELCELPEDRRTKKIFLTEAGQAYADRVLSPVKLAEKTAIAQFAEEELRLLLALMKRYADTYRDVLQEHIDSSNQTKFEEETQ